MDLSEYKDVFAAEAREYIQSLNDDLLELEQHPHDMEVLDRMFRGAHSLKGMAGTMGYDELQQFTHEMENTLNALRSGRPVDLDIINQLFTAFDLLEVLLEESLEHGEAKTDMTEVLENLQVCLNQEASPAQPSFALGELDKEEIRQAAEQGEQAWNIRVVLRSDVLMKSARAYTVIQALSRIGTIIQTSPPLADLEDERFGNEFSVLLLSKAAAEDIGNIFDRISEIEDVTVAELDLAAAKSPAPSQVTIARRRAEHFVRVETDRLDKLLNLVGELVISRTQVLELGANLDDNTARGAIVQLDRVTTELQYAAMSLRMVPIRQVFDRFPRMVRDLAQAEGKQVQLRITGQETELDRSLVNDLGEPLVHLLRNAVDHGLESPEERVAAGKSEVGTVSIAARHEGSHVVIEISDDGRGIDVEQIRQKAIKQGLIAPEANLSSRELLDLVFQPGFSTAENVTDISGRGVGMDAVRSAIQVLNGSVELTTGLGKGTTVTIKLPLTLAIIKALMVRARNEIYAIPIQSIQENILVPRQKVKTIQGEKVITLRNQVLPLLDLATQLDAGSLEDTNMLSVIVANVGQNMVGLVVDELLGQQEVVIKTLDNNLASSPGIAGATILGNGQVALILDVAGLLQGMAAYQAKAQ